MTEKEILEKQQAKPDEFYLVRVGIFLRAYGNGAFALGRATGYRVVRKERKSGAVEVCGFPASQFELVRPRLETAGAQLEELGEDMWLIHGLDGTPDESLVTIEPPRVKGRTMTIVSSEEPALNFPQADFDWLAEAIKSFNLSLSTPMDAMQFISVLQQELRRRAL